MRPADHAVWCDLWARYNAFYGREGRTALPDHVVATAWQRLFDPAEPVHGIAADLDGKMVGLVHFVFHRSMRRIELSCYLQDLFTQESARGRGVGRALIQAVGDACLAQGVRDIYWHTQESNRTARGLYDRVADNSGFIVYRQSV